MLSRALSADRAAPIVVERESIWTRTACMGVSDAVCYVGVVHRPIGEAGVGWGGSYDALAADASGLLAAARAAHHLPL